MRDDVLPNASSTVVRFSADLAGGFCSIDLCCQFGHHTQVRFDDLGCENGPIDGF